MLHPSTTSSNKLERDHTYMRSDQKLPDFVSEQKVCHLNILKTSFFQSRPL